MRTALARGVVFRKAIGFAECPVGFVAPWTECCAALANVSGERTAVHFRQAKRSNGARNFAPDVTRFEMDEACLAASVRGPELTVEAAHSLDTNRPDVHGSSRHLPRRYGPRAASIWHRGIDVAGAKWTKAVVCIASRPWIRLCGHEGMEP